MLLSVYHHLYSFKEIQLPTVSAIGLHCGSKESHQNKLKNNHQITPKIALMVFKRKLRP
jgi:hypothetical protein